MREAELRERIDWLEAENARLRALLVGDDRHWRVAQVFGLTAAEARVLACLLARPGATKDQIYEALCDGRPEPDHPQPKLMDVLICKIRKKLEPYAVTITTLWGVGWRLEAADRARLLKMTGQDHG